MKREFSGKIFPAKKLLIVGGVFLFGFLSLPPGSYFSLPILKKQPPSVKIAFSPEPQPVIKQQFNKRLSAASWLVMDLGSGSLLAGKDFHVSFPPASLTKITTALVALEYFSPNQVVTVKNAYPVGRTMGLEAGEKIRVIDLFAGLLIHSANDAAYALASNYPGGEVAFIKKMNEFVKERGLVRTRFENFDGEEDDGHYSTAYDLAQLARIFLKKPLVRELVQLRGKTVASIDGKITHKLETTNQLLGVIPGTRGLKTGWTQQAGECFVGYFMISVAGDSQPRELLTVVMGSNDRFGETVKILDWVKENVVWKDYSETHSVEIAGTNPTKP